MFFDLYLTLEVYSREMQLLYLSINGMEMAIPINHSNDLDEFEFLNLGCAARFYNVRLSFQRYSSNN
jgi:hypothetical protein